MKRADVRTHIGSERVSLLVNDDKPDRVIVAIYGERNGQRRALVVKLADLRAALDEVSS